MRFFCKLYALSKTKVAKEEFYGAKKLIKNRNVDADNIVQVCRKQGVWFMNMVKNSRKLQKN